MTHSQVVNVSDAVLELLKILTVYIRGAKVHVFTTTTTTTTTSTSNCEINDSGAEREGVDRLTLILPCLPVSRVVSILYFGHSQSVSGIALATRRPCHQSTSNSMSTKDVVEHGIKIILQLLFFYILLC